MIGLKNISIEYKSTIAFGVIAFILSLLVGVIADVEFGMVIIRSLIIMVFFSGLGFASVFVLKKFVPEFYSFINTFGSKDLEKDQPVINEATVEPGDESGDETKDNLEEGSSSEFSELLDEDVPHLASKEAGDEAISSGIDDGKLGKHIVEKQKGINFEPEILAKAVRTMMSKDED